MGGQSGEDLKRPESRRGGKSNLNYLDESDWAEIIIEILQWSLSQHSIAAAAVLPYHPSQWTEKEMWSKRASEIWEYLGRTRTRDVQNDNDDEDIVDLIVVDAECVCYWNCSPRSGHGIQMKAGRIPKSA